VLKIKAKLGELMPAKPPNDRGQGRGGNKSSTEDVLDFHRNTTAAYRKIAAVVESGMLSAATSNGRHGESTHLLQTW
jgi:hypothetical protein